ncbi:unnamed protein product [Vitrella brassicaformis CCMP3155]|uniref:GST N-terminal domain-containing protein n=1 Tax=Vitrella brassicaformis (strain CCMP3155) TaxID=1169540 RepID=A0A0G4FU66_VITBC|nr:unnamed protein product [Vitrella brassicaformis CCMP3155]|eukprot:CEM17844.1 unnamed protein product [Vitrella brassicaformis CCMP3155]
MADGSGGCVVSRKVCGLSHHVFTYDASNLLPILHIGPQITILPDEEEMMMPMGDCHTTDDTNALTPALPKPCCVEEEPAPPLPAAVVTLPAAESQQEDKTTMHHGPDAYASTPADGPTERKGGREGKEIKEAVTMSRRDGDGHGRGREYDTKKESKTTIAHNKQPEVFDEDAAPVFRSVGKSKDLMVDCEGVDVDVGVQAGGGIGAGLWQCTAVGAVQVDLITTPHVVETCEAGVDARPLTTGVEMATQAKPLTADSNAHASPAVQDAAAQPPPAPAPPTLSLRPKSNLLVELDRAYGLTRVAVSDAASPTAPKYKLLYFPASRGSADIVRLALRAEGLAYEEYHISGRDFKRAGGIFSANGLLPNLPYLTDGQQEAVGALPIMRWIAHKSTNGLMTSESDMWLDYCITLLQNIWANQAVTTLPQKRSSYTQEKDKLAYEKTLVIPALTMIDGELRRQTKGPYVLGQSISCADIAVLSVVDLAKREFGESMIETFSGIQQLCGVCEPLWAFLQAEDRL